MGTFCNLLFDSLAQPTINEVSAYCASLDTAGRTGTGSIDRISSQQATGFSCWRKPATSQGICFSIFNMDFVSSVSQKTIMFSLIVSNIVNTKCGFNLPGIVFFNNGQ